ncbi:copper amine oxidase N-terminal domain-containing protein [Tepidibacter aestuarii]|uniref:copper amine oxidase N-terminal domain-containing protein n=1 Tax=Tepidibacter aestuarii TaxID=2925782 RepID=UPI0020BF0205|nr:copper amine oxidase N-terminal domain-containing protein [Tepidibacter aestuarii]CAH2215106.1 Copper amine oxidase N-terminal domain-containing protein [Tepidibacter aestuarii]
MKKRILCLTFILILICGTLAFSSGYTKSITAYFYNIKVSLNGKTLNFSNEPFIYGGNVYVPLRDVSESLGVNVAWDDRNKTVYMHDDGSLGNNNSSYEIEMLKNQLKAKDAEIERLKDDDDDDDEDLEDLEDKLNDDYDEYTKGYKDLEFEYDLSERSNGDIKVKMTGDFERDSKYWSDRDDKDFRDFIEDEVCDEITDEFREDIQIYIYDEDDDKCAEYEYDYSDRDLDIEYEYED